MKLFNSLTGKVEVVEVAGGKVGMYTCGPTVYDYVTIGNWRTYTLGDLIARTLRYEGVEVDYVMNITDVGHLTGDNEGDASMGEDRLEKASKKEGKTAWDIARFYEEDFLAGYAKLNLLEPKVFCRATEHIQEQIDLVKKIENEGLVYRIDDGIYFDVRAYEKAGGEYGVLSTLDQIKEGARVSKNDNKRDARDFALWKFSTEEEHRQMEWESPWGMGFPGWHIECSAMGMKYLGEQFELHVGGEDLRSTHHPNEIVQSEVGTGKKPFVKHWVHGAFLQVDGGRMGKSKGNAFTLQDVEERGFEAMDLRYFYMVGHYRKQLNFTWESLGAAREARVKLTKSIERMRKEGADVQMSGHLNKEYRERFLKKLGDDLNMPEVLAVVWEVVKSELGAGEKLALLEDFERVLGLGLMDTKQLPIPEDVKQLAAARQQLRLEGKYEEADEIRDRISGMGYLLEDVGEEVRILTAGDVPVELGSGEKVGKA